MNFKILIITMYLLTMYALVPHWSISMGRQDFGFGGCTDLHPLFNEITAH